MYCYYSFAFLLLWPSTGISLEFTEKQISQAKETMTKEGKGTIKLTAEQTLEVQQMLEEFTPKFDIKKEIEQSFFDNWIGGLIFDTSLFLSTYLRHKMYGNNDVSDQVFNFIKPVLDKASLADSIQIKQANSFFSWLSNLNVFCNVFSNHNSIFINKAICDKIKSNTLSLETKNKFMYDLARTSAQIKNNWDAKILASGIIIPPLVFLGAQLINKIANKFAEGKQENSLVKKCANFTKKLSQSFLGKASIALMIIQAIYLNSKVSTDTIKLLSDMGIEHSTYNCTWSLTNPLNPLFNLISNR